MLTRFEDLPNELLVDIFSYFDVPNLYSTFWSLNRRLNNVLASLRNLSLRIDETQSDCIETFAEQVSRLKISDTSMPIDLSKFFNLRSLELERASKYLLKQICSDLIPSLNFLSISTPFYISLPSKLIDEIFSERFSSLHDVHLGRVDRFQTFSNYRSTSLRRLSLTCIDPNLICQILFICPALVSFHVRFSGQNQHILSPMLSYSKHPLKEFYLEDPYHKLNFQTLKTLFLYIINVERFVLQCACEVSFLEFVQTISDCLENLTDFHCDILEFSQPFAPSIETIQTVKSCFQTIRCSEKDNGYRRFITD